MDSVTLQEQSMCCNWELPLKDRHKICPMGLHAMIIYIQVFGVLNTLQMLFPPALSSHLAWLFPSSLILTVYIQRCSILLTCQISFWQHTRTSSGEMRHQTLGSCGASERGEHLEHECSAELSTDSWWTWWAAGVLPAAIKYRIWPV